VTETIREQLEKRESMTLCPGAALAAETRGREHPETEDPHRTAFQRDRDRILHTKAFRRLKRKTQVFLAPAGDHYRTRLTHTLEVSQIARSIARALFLNEDLTEAIALGHDLGHTPFGHAGERVLDRALEGGFRHYEQSLRVVQKLEKRRSGPGLNLTWEVRDGIVNHSRGKAVLYGKPQGAEGPATLEGLVVAVADAIGYISHDIDDALRAEVLRPEDLPRDAVATLGATTSERINTMVVGVIHGSAEGVVGIVPEVRDAMLALRTYLYSTVYPCVAIDTEIKKAERMLETLHAHLLANPLPDILEADPADSLARRTADFVAGMTDEYAMQLYRELILPSPWRG